MNSYKRNAFTYATIVALGGFVFGLDAAVISGTTKFITQEFNLTALQIGTAVSAPGFGVLFALPLAGIFSNKFGRKKVLIGIAAIYLMSAVLSALATNFYGLVAARFLGGLAFSSLSLASMYIGEIAPPEWRGKLVSMNQINIVVGLSTAYFVNYLILQLAGSGAGWVQSIGLDVNTWRFMLGSEILPALLWLILLFFIPESPSWLVYKGRNTEAAVVLEKIYDKAEIPAQIEEMKESIASSISSEDKQSIGSQLKEMFSSRYSKIVIIGATIAIAQQVSGINAILFYAPTVFEQLGGGTDTAFMQSIYTGLVGIFFTVLGLLLIDKIGRRPITIWGLAWTALSLFICAYGFSQARYTLTPEHITEIKQENLIDTSKLQSLVGVEFDSDTAFKAALVKTIGEKDTRDYSSALIQKAGVISAGLILFGILSFIAAFHFSIGPVMWVLFSEIFPISLRGIAIPTFAFVTSISSLLVQFFFPWQLENMGATTVFASYAIMVLIGFIILYFYLIETKNMSIEEIQQKLIKE
ncbi:sugar porter family MFS transporter [Aquimarina agarivorans]|uniref:sugar porter family MFS transporter n=1 Tax=Aquimarina agarivorans TaxID=980584 RepID=UPI000248FDA3|nr:sugar porter family MFS transporter [Aquimarina agarivorans]